MVICNERMAWPERWTSRPSDGRPGDAQFCGKHLIAFVVDGASIPQHLHNVSLGQQELAQSVALLYLLVNLRPAGPQVPARWPLGVAQARRHKGQLWDFCDPSDISRWQYCQAIEQSDNRQTCEKAGTKLLMHELWCHRDGYVDGIGLTALSVPDSSSPITFSMSSLL